MTVTPWYYCKTEDIFIGDDVAATAHIAANPTHTVMLSYNDSSSGIDQIESAKVLVQTITGTSTISATNGRTIIYNGTVADQMVTLPAAVINEEFRVFNIGSKAFYFLSGTDTMVDAAGTAMLIQDNIHIIPSQRVLLQCQSAGTWTMYNVGANPIRQIVTANTSTTIPYPSGAKYHKVKSIGAGGGGGGGQTSAIGAFAAGGGGGASGQFIEVEFTDAVLQNHLVAGYNMSASAGTGGTAGVGAGTTAAVGGNGGAGGATVITIGNLTLTSVGGNGAVASTGGTATVPSQSTGANGSSGQGSGGVAGLGSLPGGGGSGGGVSAANAEAIGGPGGIGNLYGGGTAAAGGAVHANAALTPSFISGVVFGGSGGAGGGSSATASVTGGAGADAAIYGGGGGGGGGARSGGTAHGGAGGKGAGGIVQFESYFY